MDNNGIIWNYSNMENITSPIFSDTAELTVTYTDPILHQVTQPVPQTGGAVGGTAPQTGGSVFSPIPHARVSVGLPVSQMGVSLGFPISQIGNVVVQQTPQAVVQQIPQVVGAVGGMVGMATGAIPRPGNRFYLPEMDHPERILSSTPTGQAPPISTIPLLTPHLRTPPGFSYPQHEQGFI